MKQNIEKQNTKHRSTFAVLFYISHTKVLQISETRKNMVIDLIYRGFF